MKIKLYSATVGAASTVLLYFVLAGLFLSGYTGSCNDSC